ncbi:MAG: thiamine-phosphate kinase, partial [Steroidobacteraceae bacterium]
LGEFELIEQYFRGPAEALRLARGDAPLGVGDDAALLQVPAGQQLVAALDTLVEGRHFPAGTAPGSLGHRALAVNLSDLAAMGAEPAWCLLALTMPAVDPAYLQQFSEGLLQLATAHRVALVGGDTTSGPLSVSVQALGFVPQGLALRRDGAQPGDLLFVSGTVGDAAAGLALEQGTAPSASLDAGQQRWLRQRFLYPTPRVELGQALRGIASACIDVSDGLGADAGKLAQASGCGATLDVEQLPLSAALRAQSGEEAARIALTGGDDYELCFTIPAADAAGLASRLANVKCAITCIGRIEKESSVRVVNRGAPVGFDVRGYDHFAGPGRS